MNPEELKKLRDVQMVNRIRVRNERIRRRHTLTDATQKMFAVKSTTTTTTPLPPIEGELILEICIHTFRYQKRLCWMLSSILQQKGDIPKIIVNVSHTDNDGSPTTEEVCNFFREKGLNIVETKMTLKQVSNRSIARNMQTKATTAHYLLFADSDMVYDPYFFEDLNKQLKTNLSKETKAMGADRISLDAAFCIKFFQEDQRIYPCEILDAASICSKFPVKWITGKGVVPGNFQLASVKAIKNRGGVYTGGNRDFWRCTRSDRGFRVHMGGRRAIIVKPQYHLNHDRGGPEIQR